MGIEGGYRRTPRPGRGGVSKGGGVQNKKGGEASVPKWDSLDQNLERGGYPRVLKVQCGEKKGTHPPTGEKRGSKRAAVF